MSPLENKEELPLNGRYNPYNPKITNDLREDYIKFFNDTVCPNAQEYINPFDGYYSIPTWKEMVSIRNELNDETSIFTKSVKESGNFEEMVKMLKVITIEEYIEFINQNKNDIR